MQLLKIKTVPFKYDINIQSARLTAPQIEPAKMTQHTTPVQVETNTENVKVRMDSSEMRSSMGMKTPADVAKEAPAKTQQTANQTTSEYVNEGNAMTQKGMTIAQYVKQKILSDSVVNTTIGVVPSSPIDVSWEPASTRTSVRRSNVELDWQKSAQEMEFIPSSMTIEVKQLAEVEIEYIGGYQYVPPSSDPDFEEK